MIDRANYYRTTEVYINIDFRFFFFFFFTSFITQTDIFHLFIFPPPEWQAEPPELDWLPLMHTIPFSNPVEILQPSM
jgi:hypothetical protein